MPSEQKRVCIDISPRIHKMLAEEARERRMTVSELATFLLVREVEAGHEADRE